MTKYSAADFANAQFAKHPDGGRGHRVADDAWRLGDSITKFSTGQLALNGWVPVPTKPTITESETIREEEAHGTNFWLGFRKGFERAGGQIIPDPEPTNAEKLAKMLREAWDRSVPFESPTESAEGLAVWLDDRGVTAPKEDN